MKNIFFFILPLFLLLNGSAKAGTPVSTGNPTENIEYRKDSTIRFEEVFAYDYSGQLTEKIEYKYSRKGLKWSAVYNYDNMGRVVSITCYNASGKAKSAQVFQYDTAGNVAYIPHRR
jgi:hypothetical protein